MNDNALISGLLDTSISRLAVKPLCGTQYLSQMPLGRLWLPVHLLLNLTTDRCNFAVVTPL